MEEFSRRDSLRLLAVGAVGLSAIGLIGGHVEAQDKSAGQAFRGQHQPKPLSFDPAKLKGLSEKLIRSHWENNYGGSVRALNTLEQRLDAMMKEKDLPPFIYGPLKREELLRIGFQQMPELRPFAGEQWLDGVATDFGAQFGN